MENGQADLVCVSHLYWDWVWQRPQHALSRLSRHYPVLYVEEPRIQIGPEFEGFRVTETHPNLQVAQLLFRSGREKFWERLDASLDRIRMVGHPFKVRDDITESSLMFESPEQPRLEREVTEYVRRWRRDVPLILWLYTPVVVKFLDLLQPDLVVYDVMDDLTSFKFAPKRLRDQEQELLSRADLVFGGGPSLYESKKGRHDDLHLFPSGVEQEHFSQALREDLPVPEDVRALGRPIIGYYGVVDERIDLELLANVAEARPEWNLVMIGPTLKIEERTLPRPGNIHYLGKRAYAQLPAYLKAFDVAMMPFAINESTRSISPTKTLEYMAGQKPIVSTPIRDVISLYGEVVRIAEGADEFVRQVEVALAESGEERARRIEKGRDLLERYSWDTIADQMHTLIQDRLARKLALKPQA
ncbi:MAG: glycosyltransferase [Chloroflexota bacterium]|nr:glycosyltransferase [Chloroflexota bacterium]